MAALACAPAVVAQSEGDERFSFTVTNQPKTGLSEQRLQVTIDRWSTDAERDQLAAALGQSGQAGIPHALRSAPAVGYLRWPGGLEYALRFARRTARPDGGADLTFVTDSRVWVWWDAKVDAPLDEPFTVFHVQMDKNNVGQGKIAPASKVRADKAVGVVVPDYDSRPVLITDFRPQRS
jgi:hypothetical protein